MFDRDKMRMMRLEKRMSQAALASAVGKTQSTIQGFEVGRYVPTLKNIEGIAAALGCSAKDLIKDGE